MIRLTCFFAAIAVFRQAAGFETAGAHGQGGAGLILYGAGAFAIAVLCIGLARLRRARAL